MAPGVARRGSASCAKRGRIVREQEEFGMSELNVVNIDASIVVHYTRGFFLGKGDVAKW